MRYSGIIFVNFLLLMRVCTFYKADISRVFKKVQDCKGYFGCAVDVPNVILTRSRCAFSCAFKCLDIATCVNFNYWADRRTCELFEYFPYKILKNGLCTNYQVFIYCYYETMTN